MDRRLAAAATGGDRRPGAHPMKATEPSIVTGTEREQTRAAYPIRDGYVERDGVRIFWELYGEGDRTILFLPTWSIIHSRTWKAQIPDFARRCRVLTLDG